VVLRGGVSMHSPLARARLGVGPDVSTNVGSERILQSAARNPLVGWCPMSPTRSPSRLRDEFDLETVRVDEIPGVVITATGIGMPIGEEELPPVLERIEGGLVTLGD
jgi:hypothetical protein